LFFGTNPDVSINHFITNVLFQRSFFTNQKCFIITGNHLAYLTAFFNSRIFRFAFKEYFPELLGDTRELSKVFFQNVPVIPVDHNLNIQFSILIDDIVNRKKKGENFSDKQVEIEKKLAEIYSLSDDDLAFVTQSEQ